MEIRGNASFEDAQELLREGAEYRKIEQTLFFRMNPIVYKNDNVMRVDMIEVNLDTNDINMTGRV